MSCEIQQRWTITGGSVTVNILTLDMVEARSYNEIASTMAQIERLVAALNLPKAASAARQS